MNPGGAPVVGGIVLAAGGGTRFGATKQLAPLRGRPLLSYAVESILSVPAVRPVVVVLGHDARAIQRQVDFQGADVVVCESWSEGQSASLRAGVEALGDVDAAVVVLGDMPRITAAAVSAVAAAATAAGPPRAVAAARATYAGKPGHPVLLGRALLDRVGELHGDVGFRDLLRGQDILDVEVGGLADPVDIDTQEELSRL